MKKFTIKSILSESAERLFLMFQDEHRSEAWLEAELLLAGLLKKDRVWIIAHQDQELNQNLVRIYRKQIQRRLRHEPIAYILGEQIFCGRVFFVNKHVLIPRPETEELVFRAVRQMKQLSDLPLVIDIGTGSGAIAVSIKKLFSKSTVLATDRSLQAIRTAKKNAKTHNVNIHFLKDNLFSHQLIREIKKRNPKYLFVLANLPYLPVSDQKILDPSVTKFEPRSALFVHGDGTDLIKKCISQIAAFQRIKKQPLIAQFEFDPPQADTLMQHARRQFPNSRLRIYKDFAGRKRFLEIKTKAA
ncbi:MAG TPA: peptide chain release factor N(5)-glutamine methyltransferase [Patescibacteria group bacterium]|nr:peptide chain release factor N(5)-glutamine methyltransferase [Patescibacteria group bacterium]